jgi:general secretion pathway protein D
MSSPSDGGRRWLPVRLAGACLLIAAIAGCASSNAYRLGQAAEQRDDFDRAIVSYNQALSQDPDNQEIASALKRARLRSSSAHYTRGRRLAGAGNYEEALIEFQLALEMNPLSGEADAAVRETRTALRTKMAVRRDGTTQLESLISRARALSPEGRELPDVTMPDTLVFREAGTRDVWTSIARFADISVVFDPQFRSLPLSIDVRGTTLPAALDAIARATGTFWRVTAPRTVTVIPDTPAKRREYEEEVIRTFYLSNADLKETLDLLRIVVDARRLSPISATNAISIKDTPERIAAAARLLAAIDKARAEVVIDVELLEIDRTRFKQYGLQIVSPGNEIGIAGQVDVNRPGGLTLEQLSNLGQGDVFFTNLPGLYYRLLKQDTDTRVLANPQLRTSDGLPAQAKFGEEVPVPQVTFAPIATGGVNQQPITSFTYRNVGVNIDITPRTHHNDDVSLAVRIEVSNLSGTGYSGLPTFGTRSITTTIRLRDGETNLLAGLIRDNERTIHKGIPGLSDLPVIGKLFASNERESQQSDIVLMLTPRIIRVLDLNEDDLRPFLAGRGTGAGTSFDVPSSTPLPARPAPQPPDEQQAPTAPFPQLPPPPATPPQAPPRTLPPPPNPPHE